MTSSQSEYNVARSDLIDSDCRSERTCFGVDSV